MFVPGMQLWDSQRFTPAYEGTDRVGIHRVFFKPPAIHHARKMCVCVCVQLYMRMCICIQILMCQHIRTYIGSMTNIYRLLQVIGMKKALGLGVKGSRSRTRGSTFVFRATYQAQLIYCEMRS